MPSVTTTVAPAVTSPPSITDRFTQLSRRVRTRIDAARLSRRFPLLSTPDVPTPDLTDRIATAHAAYVASVSSPEMAASLETAVTLWRLCEQLQPRRIMDTGSGFSSYLLRLWAGARGGVEVLSVDDDPLWLERTRRYLQAEGLDTHNLHLWSQIENRPIGRFDLIFHDLGSMESRAAALPRILQLTLPATGVVVLDDCHKRRYVEQVDRELTRWSHRRFDLTAATLDRFGRSAVLIADLRPADGGLRSAASTRAAIRVARRLAGASVRATMLPRLADSIKSRIHRYDPVTLECGVTVIPDRLHPRWKPIARNLFHERDTDRFLVEFLRPGDVAVDIGANIGLLTTIASRCVGPSGAVHTFEIDPDVWHDHLRTIRRNRLTNVLPNRIALNDRPGLVSFIKPRASWGSFMLSPVAGSAGRTDAIARYFGSARGRRRTCRAETLDRYVVERGLNRLDLVKLDVDGPELAILRGAEQTLRRFQPALMVEASMFNLDHGFDLGDLLAFLTGLGYLCFAAQRRSDTVRPITRASEAPFDISQRRGAIDLFCLLPGVHDERLALLWFGREAATRKAG